MLLVFVGDGWEVFLVEQESQEALGIAEGILTTTDVPSRTSHQMSLFLSVHLMTESRKISFSIGKVKQTAVQQTGVPKRIKIYFVGPER